MDPTDLQGVMDTQALCYPAAFQEPMAAFDSKRSRHPQGCWVACLEQEVAGYLVTLPVDEESFPALHASDTVAAQQPSMMYLHDMALSPRLRGQGVAARLLEAALERARQLQLDKLALIAVQDTELFWRHLGFASSQPVSASLLRKLATYGGDARFMTRPVHHQTAA